MDAFRDRITKLEKAVGSRRALARWMGVTDSAVAAWLSGSNPFRSTLKEVAARTGISEQWLKDGSGDENEALSIAQSHAEGVQDLAVSAPLGDLRAAMRAAGMSAADVAKRIGYQIGVVQALVDGRIQASERMITLLASIFPDLSKEEMMRSDKPVILSETPTEGTYGTTPKIRVPPGSRARFIPLLSWAQCGCYQIGHTDEAYDNMGQLAIDIDDADAFSVEADGDSMVPQINPGDKIIICPSWPVRSGDIVLLKTRDDDVYCKYLQRQTRDRVFLISSNPAHPPMDISKAELAWMYPVAEVNKKLRMR